MKSFLFSIFLFLVFDSQSQSIKYSLGMSKPQNHYFEVEMQLENFKDKEINLKLPVWAPGSYLVREFSKNINLVRAHDENGNELEVEKVTKNNWKIVRNKAKKITVNYEVYAFELTVRTSFLDLSHGFVSGSGVFMYVDGYKNLNGQLDIIPYYEFKTITTSLDQISESIAQDGSFAYNFTNYDELIDCPIEIGNQTVFTFSAANVEHTVALYGIGNYVISDLQRDMAKIVEVATDVFGQNPNKKYTFIIHNVVDGQGGLEHSNSSTLSVNRWTYEGTEYLDFLSLVAHEYFHLWNVKRIRPKELGPFDYDQENYTSLLWVMEGFTSYYDKLLLLRAGFYTPEKFLSKLQGSINYVEGTIGSRVQPLAHASFDAWIKAYRTNENSSNTQMTYYSRGATMAALFDAMIIEKYKGTKCLDHFLQFLYEKYYSKLNRGFTDDEFKSALETFLDNDLGSFFNDYIDGVMVPKYQEILSKIGVKVTATTSEKSSFGASCENVSGKLMVQTIKSNSSAENAGLSVNDEIIAVETFRVDKAALESYLAGMQEGDRFYLMISRDDIIQVLTVEIKNAISTSYLLELDNAESTASYKNYWLRTIE
jgi:predicted metalloprotease with PDZ domain